MLQQTIAATNTRTSRWQTTRKTLRTLAKTMASSVLRAHQLPISFGALLFRPVPLMSDPLHVLFPSVAPTGATGGRRIGLPLLGLNNVGGDWSNLAGQYVGPNVIAATSTGALHDGRLHAKRSGPWRRR